ncbi:hypothetical protein MKX01_015927 [Papaver californicum]|nr:hypothetical protein MKX01_015927 [Papaver californicum]
MIGGAERTELDLINFEETELRLGLPGGSTSGSGNNSEVENGKNSSGKRGFSETIDLKLNLETSLSASIKESSELVLMDHHHRQNNEKIIKSPLVSENKSITDKTSVTNCSNDDPHAKPSAPKAQVVGWPPVRSYRKNVLSVQKSNTEDVSSNNVAFVKVSMDGAPYLRKVDLKLYKSYQELSLALAKMFSSFTIGNCETQGMKDFMNESKLMDLLNGSEYVPTYEDKDGDWMLVGDVPWRMFVESCKRLRIMKGSEAIGLAPRAVEKCRNRS